MEGRRGTPGGDSDMKKLLHQIPDQGEISRQNPQDVDLVFLPFLMSDTPRACEWGQKSVSGQGDFPD